MQNLMAQISLLSIIGVTAISLSSCGISKVKECNSIGKITKEMKTAVDELEAESPGNVAQAFISTSSKVDKLSKEMQAITITDDKLVSLQSQFVKLYQDNSKGLKDAAKGLQTKNQPVADAAIAKMMEGDKQEAVMIKSLNEYCEWTVEGSNTKPATKTTPNQKK
jgi:uncharacterized membrane-anchored protein YhcB (DUF1043 family)